MRVAIYARYSSDNQRDASIEDQVRLCKTRIDHEGWQLVATYSDRAISGSSTFLRPGYQKLLEEARGECWWTPLMLSRTVLRLRINVTCTHVTCVFFFVPVG